MRGEVKEDASVFFLGALELVSSLRESLGSAMILSYSISFLCARLFVFVEVEYGYLYVAHVDGAVIVDVCIRFPVR